VHVGEQCRLTDACFTADDQYRALAFPGTTQQPLQHLLLASPTQQHTNTDSVPAHGSHGGTEQAPPWENDPGVFPGSTADGRCFTGHGTYRSEPLSARGGDTSSRRRAVIPMTGDKTVHHLTCVVLRKFGSTTVSENPVSTGWPALVNLDDAQRFAAVT
jgi:hypothetical protein